MKTYKTWMKNFIKEDTPRGDLARDMKQDKDFPATMSRSKISEHLQSKNICMAAERVFNETYNEYKKQESRGKNASRK